MEKKSKKPIDSEREKLNEEFIEDINSNRLYNELKFKKIIKFKLIFNNA